MICGRYVLRSDNQKIADHFAVHSLSLPDFEAALERTARFIERLSEEKATDMVALSLF